MLFFFFAFPIFIIEFNSYWVSNIVLGAVTIYISSSLKCYAIFITLIKCYFAYLFDRTFNLITFLTTTARFLAIFNSGIPNELD